MIKLNFRIHISFFLLLLAGSCSAQDRIEMVLIEGNNFIMGSEQYRSGKPHKVVLDDYYFATDLVSVSDWKEFCSNTEYNYNWQDMKDFINHWRETFWYLDPLPDLEIDSTWPIIHVNWYEAILYCNWLSRKHGFDEVYDISVIKYDYDYDYLSNNRLNIILKEEANGYRLPTEAEWEYVAQKSFLDPDFDTEYIEYNGLPIPLTQLKPNNLNIFNMDTNSKTWCWDYFDFEYYEKSDYESPKGPNIANIDTRQLYPGEVEAYGEDIFHIRVARGGSIYSDPGLGFIYNRSRYVDTRRFDTGIRLVRNKK